ncbi:hypothetical protein MJO28_009515 [Puccinia striiformis f. sp. tritici]|uniref:Uncharacterized protein n=1 Tax=Puccinia striiformis f. sp. tritici TaxID=168172 RepID=A0ACC0E7W6_9BASI|nr:hypothetical protein MJO28_009515 [Puccinia striiformis f. sp. tritici]
MAEEQWELGGMTGLLKYKVVELNGKAINSFSLVAHEVSFFCQSVFKEVCMLNCVWKFFVCWTSDPIVEKNLQLAFSNFNWQLKRLIDSIPLASQAASLGLQVSKRIHKEHYKLKMKLLHQTNKSGKQLERDVQLTGRSIQTARALHTGLKETWSNLVSYHNHVSLFKMSILCFAPSNDLKRSTQTNMLQYQAGILLTTVSRLKMNSTL